jgi:hypothetical protein
LKHPIKGWLPQDILAYPSLRNGSEFYLLRLMIKERIDFTRRVPEKLSDIPQPDLA